MIIKTIDIENFLSYYGKNEIKFSDGPTIIIGQNNTGKSKLFDAFNWVLYDKAYKTEEETWYETKEWLADIVNRKAKKECSEGGAIITSVSLIFYDEEDNKYLLTREYEIKKNGKNSWDVPKKTQLYLTKTEAITHNNTDFFNQDAVDKIKELFPTNLSKYFLFQGESISQIMSLSSRSAFNSALRDLSRIQVFENAKSFTNKVYKRINKEFEEKEDSDKKLQERKVELSNEIEYFKQQIETSDKELQTHIEERDKAKEVLDKKDNEIKKFEECGKLLNKIETLENQLRIRNDHRISEYENQQKAIFDEWMYAGTEKIIQSFLEFYNKNKKAKRIPEPIRQDFVKEMLSEELCKICGTPAPKGTDQYNNIHAHLSDKSLDKEIEMINALSTVADITLMKVKSIPGEISNFHERLAKINEDIDKLKSQIKIKEEELRNVIPKDITKDELKLKDFARLQEDRERIKNEIEKIKTLITRCSLKKENAEKELELKEKEYQDLIFKSSNKKEQAKVILAKKINEVTSDFYDKFLNKLISDIQDSANTYFKKMTELNKALSGNVRVDSQVDEVYTIDEDGNRIYNINQANKVSLQISFVAAVLSVSNSFWETYFPFVADAPISALGGNNKLTAVKTMIEIFKQSIIILKDDAITEDPESVKSDLIRDLIDSNKKITNAYELVLIGDTLEDQHTQIRKLK
ncbi:MAG: AAA family ATPase [Ignavibacterium sp.]|nr:AAA family ATPase [Ignavibacterium sp.]